VTLHQTLEAIRPHPRPSAKPLLRKTYLWVIALVGGGICIAVLAAALAPSHGNHVQPIGGVLGFAGLFLSSWIAWYARCVPTGTEHVDEARARLRARQQALNIVKQNPQLATELGIGRPELEGTFDDGGLVDVNAVPLSVLQSLPGIAPALAERIAATRAEIGGFDSAVDMEIVLDLPPGALTHCLDRLIFRRP
jgi:hypothetical protein